MSKQTPITIASENVTNDLLSTANTWGVSADALDFDLISYETFYRLDEDSEWSLVQNDSFPDTIGELELRSPSFELRQVYTIDVHYFQPNPHFDLRLSIATDKTKSKAVAIIDPSSKIPLKKGIQTWVKDAVVRKQLRHGHMIGIYDHGLEKEITRMLVKIQKEGPLQSPYRLPIGEFLPPVLPVHDTVLLHYKKFKKENSMIEGVPPDTLVLEYVFPKYGRDGRGCSGQHIPVEEPTVKYKGFVVIDNKTMYSKEDTQSIRFYSSVSGYVLRKKGVFLIGQELSIEAADFKNTGSIETGMDKDVHLKIKRKTSSEDAVGTGVNIDVQKLDVSGTVGRSAKIQACEVNIAAQTHKKSEITVTENASIHLHRGNLKAKEANIDVLETGKIEADTVRIKKMVGGEVIAREVYIDHLYSNGRVIAQELIEIQLMEGDGNKLIIDPHSIEAYHEKIHELELDIRDKTSRLQLQSKEFLAKQISFKEKNARIKQFQQRIIEAQKNNQQPMKADVVRVQQYKTEAAELKEEHLRLEEDERHIHSLQAELNRLFEADLHAKVVHHGVHNGKNRILFIDPKTRQEYAVTPTGKYLTVRLTLEGEDKRILLES
ncbi:MAG: hypothetical protein AB7S65_03380 [Sulfuricurvum sp.]